MKQTPTFLESLIQAELESDETILWQEMPIQHYFNTDVKYTFALGIIITAFILFIGYFILIEGELISLVFITPFLLIGLFMLSAPLWNYWKLGRSIYFITDKRAVTIESGFSMTVQSYPPQRLEEVRRRKNKNGTFDILFRYEKYFDSDNTLRTIQAGFISIANDQEAIKQIKKLVNQSDNKATTKIRKIS